LDLGTGCVVALHFDVPGNRVTFFDVLKFDVFDNFLLFDEGKLL
jgi:hypothetical protein